jgi:hypothetical protein
MPQRLDTWVSLSDGCLVTPASPASGCVLVTPACSWLWVVLPRAGLVHGEVLLRLCTLKVPWWGVVLALPPNRCCSTWLCLRNQVMAESASSDTLVLGEGWVTAVVTLLLLEGWLRVLLLPPAVAAVAATGGGPSLPAPPLLAASPSPRTSSACC